MDLDVIMEWCGGEFGWRKRMRKMMYLHCNLEKWKKEKRKKEYLK